MIQANMTVRKIATPLALRAANKLLNLLFEQPSGQYLVTVHSHQVVKVARVEPPKGLDAVDAEPPPKSPPPSEVAAQAKAPTLDEETPEVQTEPEKAAKRLAKSTKCPKKDPVPEIRS